MRFSLGMLFLISLWVSLALLVWVRREAWALEGKSIPFHRDFRIGIESDTSQTSPDETRYIDPHYPFRLVTPYGSPIYDLYPAMMHARQKVSRSISLEGFLDDDTLAVSLSRDESTSFVSDERVFLRRRFPEWWWGHFYRLEVWAFAVLTIILLVRFVRSRNQRIEAVSA